MRTEGVLMQDNPQHREKQIERWLETQIPAGRFRFEKASEDASFRRYFRVFVEGEAESRILMDAPPNKEDCRPFIDIQGRLSKAGVNVPVIFQTDLENGFLLLSDLGTQTYLDVLDTANPEAAALYYANALGALLAFQKSAPTEGLPEYDEARLLAEMRLFPEWYVRRHKGVHLAPERLAQMESMFAQIIAVNRAEARVFVHRDFHARNLMACTPGPGILDFQDAVLGPLSYDLVSLFKDAYIGWDEAFCLDLLARYWETARRFELPVPSDFAVFFRNYEWMGVQRHLKVLGIFARLYHRDGKAQYLDSMPRVMRLLRKTCQRYRELGPLWVLLNEMEPEAAEVGYTF
jgi:N-acetylmuramate 1-kinase